MAYEEQTLVHPEEHLEVYGQDDYGWYTYAEYVEDVPDRFPFPTEDSPNPLFVTLKGATQSKLLELGFFQTE